MTAFLLCITWDSIFLKSTGKGRDDIVVYFLGRSTFIILGGGGWSGSRLMTWTAAPQYVCKLQKGKNKTNSVTEFGIMKM